MANTSMPNQVDLYGQRVRPRRARPLPPGPHRDLRARPRPDQLDHCRRVQPRAEHAHRSAEGEPSARFSPRAIPRQHHPNPRSSSH